MCNARKQEIQQSSKEKQTNFTLANLSMSKACSCDTELTFEKIKQQPITAARRYLNQSKSSTNLFLPPSASSNTNSILNNNGFDTGWSLVHFFSPKLNSFMSHWPEIKQRFGPKKRLLISFARISPFLIVTIACQVMAACQGNRRLFRCMEVWQGQGTRPELCPRVDLVRPSIHQSPMEPTTKITTRHEFCMAKWIIPCAKVIYSNWKRNIRAGIICLCSLRFWCWSHGSFLWYH